MAAHQAPPSLGFSRQEHWRGLPFLLQCMKMKSESEVSQSCPTLNQPGSSVHGIFQARVLEWVAIAFSVETSSKMYFWNRSPAQVGYMRHMLGAGALGRPRGIGWGGRWEGGSGWGTHVSPRLIHVNVWQKPLQYCQVISLQLMTINGKRKKRLVRCK